ncbi:MAG: hypothetical protein ACTHJ2_05330 [Candidatus Nitrosocosmicus sp.]
MIDVFGSDNIIAHNLVRRCMKARCSITYQSFDLAPATSLPFEKNRVMSATYSLYQLSLEQPESSFILHQ